VVDVLNARSRLGFVVSQNDLSIVVALSAQVSNRHGLLSAILARFISLGSGSRTGLGPSIDHLDFLDTATHHSVIRVLVRAKQKQETPAHGHVNVKTPQQTFETLTICA